MDTFNRHSCEMCKRLEHIMYFPPKQLLFFITDPFSDISLNELVVLYQKTNFLQSSAFCTSVSCWYVSAGLCHDRQHAQKEGSNYPLQQTVFIPVFMWSFFFYCLGFQTDYNQNIRLHVNEASDLKNMAVLFKKLCTVHIISACYFNTAVPFIFSTRHSPYLLAMT